MGDHAEVFEPCAFGPLLERFSFLGLLLSSHGIEKEAGIVDHADPGDSVGSLVVFEPSVQVSGRHRLLGQVGEQLLGMLGVGARQWDQDAGGGPGGELLLAYRLK